MRRLAAALRECDNVVVGYALRQHIEQKPLGRYCGHCTADLLREECECEFCNCHEHEPECVCDDSDGEGSASEAADCAHCRFAWGISSGCVCDEA